MRRATYSHGGTNARQEPNYFPVYHHARHARNPPPKRKHYVSGQQRAPQQQQQERHPRLNNVLSSPIDSNSQSKRGRAQEIAATVPNVQQVVSELQVRDIRNFVKLGTVQNRKKGNYALDTRSRILDFVAFGI
jgi:hypothetical protein